MINKDFHYKPTLNDYGNSARKSWISSIMSKIPSRVGEAPAEEREPFRVRYPSLHEPTQIKKYLLKPLSNKFLQESIGDKEKDLIDKDNR